MDEEDKNYCIYEKGDWSEGSQPIGNEHVCDIHYNSLNEGYFLRRIRDSGLLHLPERCSIRLLMTDGKIVSAETHVEYIHGTYTLYVGVMCQGLTPVQVLTQMDIKCIYIAEHPEIFQRDKDGIRLLGEPQFVVGLDTTDDMLNVDDVSVTEEEEENEEDD